MGSTSLRRPARHALVVPLGQDRTAIYSPITRASVTLNVTEAVLNEGIRLLDDSVAKELEASLLLASTDETDMESFERYCTIRDLYRYNSTGIEYVIHLTHACNLRCPYCYENGIDRSVALTRRLEEDISTYLEKSLAEELPERVHLTFIGGEPLLEPSALERIVRRVRTSCPDPEVLIVTNGTLVDGEFLDACVAVGVERFQITVDGDRTTHDNLRVTADGGQTFDLILHNIALIEARSPTFTVTVNCNLSPQDCESVPGLLAALAGIGFRGDLIFSWVFGGAFTGFESVLDKGDQAWRFTHQLVETHGFRHDPFYRAGYLACAMYARPTRIIGADGCLYSCFAGVGRPSYRIGLVSQSDSPLFEVMQALWLERDCFSPSCVTCEFIAVCNGNCTFLNDMNGYTCPRVSLRRNELELLRCRLES